jgi:release factor glutamine methyltransferase
VIGTIAPDDARTVGELLSELGTVLAAAGAEDAPRESRDIVAAVLDMPRLWPSLHRDEPLARDAIDAARRAAAARASGAPFAYAVGRAPFRHLVLDVDERVLIPRQETELLVELALERVREPGGIAVDVGTGSGAVALALAQEGRFDRVIATDVSRGALEVAAGNAARLGPALRAPVELRHGSLLAPVEGVRARAIVSNPPYIAHDEAPALPRSVRDWEPAVALFSADGGMAATARLIRGAAALLEPGGVLALEVDARRASLAAELALADGRYREIAVRLDLAGRERILLATRTDG